MTRARAEPSSGAPPSPTPPMFISASARATQALRALLCAVTCAGAPRGAPSAAARTDAPLTFRVNTARRHAVSRFIYGANAATEPAPWAGATPPREVSFNRMGGNRLSAYNWTNNYSNAGSDAAYHNDQYLAASTTPGEAVRARAAATFARGAAFLATVPMLPYVAGDACNCDVGTSDVGRAARLAAHFRRNAASSTAGAADDGTVYQDAFVRWATHTFPGATGDSTRRLMFSLDNEPDAWHATHKEVESDQHDDPSAPRVQTYDAFIDTTIAFARAVKRAAPDALVFGPALATYTGILTLGRHPADDPTYGSWRARPFLDVYLDRLRAAESEAGRRLLDVVDVHWYPAAGTRGGPITNDYAPQDSATVEARLQAPRSLWDSTYDEHSWVSDVTAGPVRLLPRLRAQIAAHYPGTRLAVSEYYYGRAGDISGGIAQADVLGVFGREGVYAAALWPQANPWAPPYAGDGARAYAYAFAAFRMYLNYDGAGSCFGDLGVDATTSDADAASVYASLDARGRVVLVAINKRRTARTAQVVVAHPAALRSARVYTLTAGAPAPARAPDLALPAGNAFPYTMPALSVSTLVLSP
ncbi:endoglucanase [Gemmatimonadetes bacterium T265]|nr:endoglucanase [Gemmatimonadetes bacterium T265]